MFEGELNLKDYKDEYKEELRKIIEARVAGEEYVAEEVEEPPTNVVDLMAALRKSLDAASSAKKKPARPNCRREDCCEGEPKAGAGEASHAAIEPKEGPQFTGKDFRDRPYEASVERAIVYL
jgi:hypothetical protein